MFEHIQKKLFEREQQFEEYTREDIKKLILRYKKPLTIGSVSFVLLTSFAVFAHVGHDHDEDIENLKAAVDVSRQGIQVVTPQLVRAEDSVAPNYIGTLYSKNFGQVFAFREGIIDQLLVDVGSEVKKGQLLGTLSSQTFTPELADIVAGKKSDITIAQAKVSIAQEALSIAEQQRQQYLKLTGGEPTVSQAQLDKVLESVKEASQVKLEKLAQDIKLVDSDITIAEQTIASAKEQAQREQEIAQEKLAILGTTLSTSVRYAYDNLVDVFFDGTFSRSKLTHNNTFGQMNSGLRDSFGLMFTRFYTRIDDLDTMNDQELESYAQELVVLLNKGVSVLEFTLPSGTYTSTDLLDDKQKIIDAKIDPDNGLVTWLSDYEQERLGLVALEAQFAQQVRTQELKIEQLTLQKQQQENGLRSDIAESKRETTESYQDILSKKLESQQQLQEFDKGYLEAKAGLQLAQAELRAAQQALATFQEGGYNNQIRAPYAGIITQRHATIGQAIDATESVFDIVDTSQSDEKFVRFSLPEKDFVGVEEDMTITFVRVQEPLVQYHASISRIAQAVDPETKSILIEALLQEDDKKLLLGSTVIVMLPEQNDKYLIPTAAVGYDADGTYVYKVINNVLFRQNVSTAETLADKVYITEGLSNDDKIIKHLSTIDGKTEGDTVEITQGLGFSSGNKDSHDHDHDHEGEGHDGHDH